MHKSCMYSSLCPSTTRFCRPLVVKVKLANEDAISRGPVGWQLVEKIGDPLDQRWWFTYGWRVLWFISASQDCLSMVDDGIYIYTMYIYIYAYDGRSWCVDNGSANKNCWIQQFIWGVCEVLGSKVGSFRWAWPEMMMLGISMNEDQQVHSNTGRPPIINQWCGCKGFFTMQVVQNIISGFEGCWEQDGSSKISRQIGWLLGEARKGRGCCPGAQASACRGLWMGPLSMTGQMYISPVTWMSIKYD